MTNPTDGDDELNEGLQASSAQTEEELAAQRAQEEKSGEGTKGKAGSAGGGVKFSSSDSAEEAAQKRAKKGGDEGEGDQDSFGRGKAGAGAGGGIRVSPQKLKEIMADWRHLDVTAVMEAVAEFFSELPMRVSANCEVTWEKTKSNVKSFAIVNWAIEAGEKAVRELAKNRDRTRARGAGRDTRGLVQRQPSTGMSMKLGPAGPTTR
jgi:hypothetical protein